MGKPRPNRTTGARGVLDILIGGGLAAERNG
jgi:hypothetical protein